MIGTIINFTIVDNYHSVTSYEIPMFASKIALLEVTNLPQNGSFALRAGGGPLPLPPPGVSRFADNRKVYPGENADKNTILQAS